MKRKPHFFPKPRQCETIKPQSEKKQAQGVFFWEEVEEQYVNHFFF